MIKTPFRGEALPDVGASQVIKNSDQRVAVSSGPQPCMALPVQLIALKSKRFFEDLHSGSKAFVASGGFDKPRRHYFHYMACYGLAFNPWLPTTRPEIRGDRYAWMILNERRRAGIGNSDPTA
ncbi:hypothetical protein [Salinicola peritrichatus]|uniref:hypothetical protein n=1 Tax=Salinicola peritrichatus TaxID=1267424 RepID=UPI0013A664BA|nr:hypothetical protein [Salinicola peritrichatus]